MRLPVLLRRVPRTIRLGTLQLVVLLVALTLLVGSLVARGARNSFLLDDLAAAQLSRQTELQRLSGELRQWRQFGRIVSALDFLSQSRLRGDDLIQTSRMLYGMSRSVGFDPLLILAVVSVESRGNPAAQGKFRSGNVSGAVGLMQIKYETARIVGRSIRNPVRREWDLLRPDVNLLYGTAYLLQMVNRYGSLEKGLIAYNMGPGALESALAGHRRLPRRYYNRVLSNYRGLVQRFGEDPFDD